MSILEPKKLKNNRKKMVLSALMHHVISVYLTHWLTSAVVGWFVM